MEQESSKNYQEFIRFIANAVANISLYSKHHPQVVRLGQQATDKLKRVMGEKKALSFLRIDEDLIVDNVPLPKSIYLSRFVRVLRQHGIEHITFSSQVTAEDLLSFIAGLLNNEKQPLCTGRNITLGHVEIKKNGRANNPDAANEGLKKLQLCDIPHAEILKFAEIYEEIRKKRKLHVEGVGEIVACFIDALRSEAGSFTPLASIRMMDEYTFTHSTNVCVLNLAQALSLNIDGPVLHDIGVAAMLHDVGKLFIPEEVLCKPDKLNDEEWDLMQQHPVKGAQYLLDTPGITPLATVTAFEHHRKFNGSGYPRVNRSWELNLCSQMTAISDIFDALRTKRSYQDPLEIKTVIEKIADMAGTELHPGLTENFLSLLAPFVHPVDENTENGLKVPEEIQKATGHITNSFSRQITAHEK